MGPRRRDSEAPSPRVRRLGVRRGERRSGLLDVRSAAAERRTGYPIGEMPTGSSGWDSARTLVVHDDDAFRGDCAFRHRECRWDRAIGKQPFSTAQRYRIYLQPERIDQIMLHERLNEIRASKHVQIRPFLLLEFGDFFRNVSVQKHGRLPFVRRHGIRSDVLGRRLDAGHVPMLRPKWRPDVKGLAPQQQVARHFIWLLKGRCKNLVAM